MATERVVIVIPEGTNTKQAARFLEAAPQTGRVRGNADGSIVVYVPQGTKTADDE